MPGPPPKKDKERRRRNKTTESEGSLSHIPATVVNVDELLAGDVEIPDPPTYFDDCKDSCAADCDKHTGEERQSWHPIALQMYHSVVRSGQVIWMEPSDWSALYLMCESISRDLKPQVVGINEESGEPIFATIPLKGASLNAYLKAMGSLMMLEGDRRKLRIELERQRRLDAAAEGDNKVVDIVKHRQDAFKGA